MSKRRTTVTEVDWIDAIAVARIIKRNAEGKKEYTSYSMQKVVQMALALLRLDGLKIGPKP